LARSSSRTAQQEFGDEAKVIGRKGAARKATEAMHLGSGQQVEPEKKKNGHYIPGQFVSTQFVSRQFANRKRR
jgi:hypothetical protein